MSRSRRKMLRVLQRDVPLNGRNLSINPRKGGSRSRAVGSYRADGVPVYLSSANGTAG